jgi:hypothetical protein
MKNVSKFKYNNVLIQCSNEQVNNIQSLPYDIIASGNVIKHDLTRDGGNGYK